MSAGPSWVTISKTDFDALPFGIIQVNRGGTILQYNAYESELSGYAKSDVVGKNFFTEVAPCTDVAHFHGRLLSMDPKAGVNMQFPFTFPFKTPRHVFIHIVSGPIQTYWIFVSESASDRTLEMLLERAAKKQ